MLWRYRSRDATRARGVRRAFVAFLRAGGAPEGDFDGAELIFGELVGNVALHAPGAVEISVDWFDVYPILRVRDFGGGFRGSAGNALPADPAAEGGRGMYIVRALARAVSWSYDAGTVVEAELPVPRARNRPAVAGPAVAVGV